MARTEEATPKVTVAGVNAAVSGEPGRSDGDKVRVFVRLRPLLPLEEFAGEVSAWEAVGAHGLRCKTTQSHGGATGGPHSYDASAHAYDRVFAQGVSSHEVYAGAVAGVVEQAMAGYHGTVFAYGQTGSGKTHTMRSMMEHASSAIFEHILSEPGREFAVRLAVLEIYNEEVYDMLRDSGSPGSGGGLRLREDVHGKTHVEGLGEAALESAGQLLQMLEQLERRRRVRETKSNERSSRSHVVVRLTIESRPSRSPQGPGLPSAPSHGSASTSYDDSLDDDDGFMLQPPPLHSSPAPAPTSAAAAAKAGASPAGARQLFPAGLHGSSAPAAAAVAGEVAAFPARAAGTGAPPPPRGSSGGGGGRRGSSRGSRGSGGGGGASLPSVHAVLNFVDLAGSERMTFGPTGEDERDERMRQKEASNINKSLLTMGRVIRALGDPHSRTRAPFRESKLTRLLATYLGGNAVVSIICTVSPGAEAVEHTHSCLRFANAAKKVAIAPQVNEVRESRGGNDATGGALEAAHAAQREIEALRAQLSAGDPSRVHALGAALSAKQAEVDALRARLAGMERLVLRADGHGGLIAARRSYDVPAVALALAPSIGGGGPASRASWAVAPQLVPGGGTGGGSPATHASWAVTPQLAAGIVGGGSGGPAVCASWAVAPQQQRAQQPPRPQHWQQGPPAQAQQQQQHARRPGAATAAFGGGVLEDYLLGPRVRQAVQRSSVDPSGAFADADGSSDCVNSDGDGNNNCGDGDGDGNNSDGGSGVGGGEGRAAGGVQPDGRMNGGLGGEVGGGSDRDSGVEGAVSGGAQLGGGRWLDGEGGPALDDGVHRSSGSDTGSSGGGGGGIAAGLPEGEEGRAVGSTIGSGGSGAALSECERIQQGTVGGSGGEGGAGVLAGGVGEQDGRGSGSASSSSGGSGAGEQDGRENSSAGSSSGNSGESPAAGGWGEQGAAGTHAGAPPPERALSHLLPAISEEGSVPTLSDEDGQGSVPLSPSSSDGSGGARATRAPACGSGDSSDSADSRGLSGGSASVTGALASPGQHPNDDDGAAAARTPARAAASPSPAAARVPRLDLTALTGEPPQAAAVAAATAAIAAMQAGLARGSARAAAASAAAAAGGAADAPQLPPLPEQSPEVRAALAALQVDMSLLKMSAGHSLAHMQRAIERLSEEMNVVRAGATARAEQPSDAQPTALVAAAAGGAAAAAVPAAAAGSEGGGAAAPGTAAAASAAAAAAAASAANKRLGLLDALKAEVARLRRAQQVRDKADSALSALRRRLGGAGPDGGQPGDGSGGDGGSWGADFVDIEAEEASLEAGLDAVSEDWAAATAVLERAGSSSFGALSGAAQAHRYPRRSDSVTSASGAGIGGGSGAAEDGIGGGGDVVEDGSGGAAAAVLEGVAGGDEGGGGGTPRSSSAVSSRRRRSGSTAVPQQPQEQPGSTWELALQQHGSTSASQQQHSSTTDAAQEQHGSTSASQQQRGSAADAAQSSDGAAWRAADDGERTDESGGGGEKSDEAGGAGKAGAGGSARQRHGHPDTRASDQLAPAVAAAAAAEGEEAAGGSPGGAGWGARSAGARAGAVPRSSCSPRGVARRRQPSASDGADADAARVSALLPRCSSDVQRRGGDGGVSTSSVVGGAGGGGGGRGSLNDAQRAALKECYRGELRRAAAAFRASVGREVAELVEAMDELREHNERLELHKRLLLGQVVELEGEASQAGARADAAERQAAQLAQSLDRARFEVVCTKQMARDLVAAAEARAAAASDAGEPRERVALDFIDMNGEWGDQESPEVLLPRICSLWAELAVPLLYRTRFYRSDRLRCDAFFLEMELRKLDLRRSLFASGHVKELERAKAALEVEGRSLAAALKRLLPHTEREQLLREWGVSLHTKGRKMQLVRMLWDEKTLRQASGAPRSAAMVARLAGLGDNASTAGGASDALFMREVFGGPPVQGGGGIVASGGGSSGVGGAGAAPSGGPAERRASGGLGAAVSGALAKALATPRQASGRLLRAVSSNQARIGAGLPPTAPVSGGVDVSGGGASVAGGAAPTPRRLSSLSSWRLPFTPRAQQQAQQ
ncbi:hypothetical protein FOA52_013328 [Chlamydomonas sp. UWO 241]|nr:hypothetical protein FOA52_013328 [Chlamydomonas sp. UWO 241]